MTEKQPGNPEVPGTSAEGEISTDSKNEINPKEITDRVLKIGGDLVKMDKMDFDNLSLEQLKTLKNDHEGIRLDVAKAAEQIEKIANEREKSGLKKTIDALGVLLQRVKQKFDAALKSKPAETPVAEATTPSSEVEPEPEIASESEASEESFEEREERFAALIAATKTFEELIAVIKNNKITIVTGKNKFMSTAELVNWVVLVRDKPKKAGSATPKLGFRKKLMQLSGQAVAEEVPEEPVKEKKPRQERVETVIAPEIVEVAKEPEPEKTPEAPVVAESFEEYVDFNKFSELVNSVSSPEMLIDIVKKNKIKIEDNKIFLSNNYLLVNLSRVENKTGWQAKVQEFVRRKDTRPPRVEKPVEPKEPRKEAVKKPEPVVESRKVESTSEKIEKFESFASAGSFEEMREMLKKSGVKKVKEGGRSVEKDALLEFIDQAENDPGRADYGNMPAVFGFRSKVLDLVDAKMDIVGKTDPVMARVVKGIVQTQREVYGDKPSSEKKAHVAETKPAEKAKPVEKPAETNNKTRDTNEIVDSEYVERNGEPRIDRTEIAAILDKVAEEVKRIEGQPETSPDAAKAEYVQDLENEKVLRSNLESARKKFAELYHEKEKSSSFTGKIKKFFFAKDNFHLEEQYLAAKEEFEKAKEALVEAQQLRGEKLREFIRSDSAEIDKILTDKYKAKDVLKWYRQLGEMNMYNWVKNKQEELIQKKSEGKIGEFSFWQKQIMDTDLDRNKFWQWAGKFVNVRTVIGAGLAFGSAFELGKGMAFKLARVGMTAAGGALGSRSVMDVAHDQWNQDALGYDKVFWTEDEAKAEMARRMGLDKIPEGTAESLAARMKIAKDIDKKFILDSQNPTDNLHKVDDMLRGIKAYAYVNGRNLDQDQHYKNLLVMREKILQQVYEQNSDADYPEGTKRPEDLHDFQYQSEMQLNNFELLSKEIRKQEFKRKVKVASSLTIGAALGVFRAAQLGLNGVKEFFGGSAAEAVATHDAGVTHEGVAEKLAHAPVVEGPTSNALDYFKGVGLSEKAAKLLVGIPGQQEMAAKLINAAGDNKDFIAEISKHIESGKSLSTLIDDAMVGRDAAHNSISALVENQLAHHAAEFGFDPDKLNDQGAISEWAKKLAGKIVREKGLYGKDMQTWLKFEKGKESFVLLTKASNGEYNIDLHQADTLDHVNIHEFHVAAPDTFVRSAPIEGNVPSIGLADAGGYDELNGERLPLGTVDASRFHVGHGAEVAPSSTDIAPKFEVSTNTTNIGGKDYYSARYSVTEGGHEKSLYVYYDKAGKLVGYNDANGTTIIGTRGIPAEVPRQVIPHANLGEMPSSKFFGGGSASSPEATPSGPTGAETVRIGSAVNMAEMGGSPVEPGSKIIEGSIFKNLTVEAAGKLGNRNAYSLANMFLAKGEYLSKVGGLTRVAMDTEIKDFASLYGKYEISHSPKLKEAILNRMTSLSRLGGMKPSEFFHPAVLQEFGIKPEKPGIWDRLFGNGKSK